MKFALKKTFFYLFYNVIFESTVRSLSNRPYYNIYAHTC